MASINNNKIKKVVNSNKINMTKKVKKHKPPKKTLKKSQFAKNFVKSFKDFGINTTMNVLAPDFNSTIKNTSNAFKQIKLPDKGSIKNNRIVKDAKDLVKNTSVSFLDELKSGNWFGDKKFEEKAMEAAKAAGGMAEFNEEDWGAEGLDDIDWGDDDSSDVNLNYNNTNENMFVDNRTSNYNQMSVQNINSGANASMLSAMTTSLLGGMGQVSEQITQIAGFQASTTQDFYDRSLSFYDSTTDTLTKISDSIENFFERYKENEEDNEPENQLSQLFGESGFNPELLFANINKSVENLFAEGGNYDLYMGMAKTMLTDPMKFISESLIKTIIPEAVKEYTESFNEKFVIGMKSVISRFIDVNRGGKGGPIQKWLGKLFNIRGDVNSTIESSAVDYNKSAISFDGVTKKAITHVIPSYLSKILEQTTITAKIQQELINFYEKGVGDKIVENSDRDIFDYDNNTFISNKKAIENIKKSKDDEYMEVIGNELKMSYDSNYKKQIERLFTDEEKDKISKTKNLEKQIQNNDSVFDEKLLKNQKVLELLKERQEIDKYFEEYNKRKASRPKRNAVQEMFYIRSLDEEEQEKYLDRKEKEKKELEEFKERKKKLEENEIYKKHKYKDLDEDSLKDLIENKKKYEKTLNIKRLDNLKQLEGKKSSSELQKDAFNRLALRNSKIVTEVLRDKGLTNLDNIDLGDLQTKAIELGDVGSDSFNNLMLLNAMINDPNFSSKANAGIVDYMSTKMKNKPTDVQEQLLMTAEGRKASGEDLRTEEERIKDYNDNKKSFIENQNLDKTLLKSVDNRLVRNNNNRMKKWSELYNKDDNMIENVSRYLGETIKYSFNNIDTTLSSFFFGNDKGIRRNFTQSIGDMFLGKDSPIAKILPKSWTDKWQKRQEERDKEALRIQKEQFEHEVRTDEIMVGLQKNTDMNLTTLLEHATERHSLFSYDTHLVHMLRAFFRDVFGYKVNENDIEKNPESIKGKVTKNELDSVNDKENEVEDFSKDTLTNKIKKRLLKNGVEGDMGSLTTDDSLGKIIGFKARQGVNKLLNGKEFINDRRMAADAFRQEAEEKVKNGELSPDKVVQYTASNMYEWELNNQDSIKGIKGKVRKFLSDKGYGQNFQQVFKGYDEKMLSDYKKKLNKEAEEKIKNGELDKKDKDKYIEKQLFDYKLEKFENTVLGRSTFKARDKAKNTFEKVKDKSKTKLFSIVDKKEYEAQKEKFAKRADKKGLTGEEKEKFINEKIESFIKNDKKYNLKDKTKSFLKEKGNQALAPLKGFYKKNEKQLKRMGMGTGIGSFVGGLLGHPMIGSAIGGLLTTDKMTEALIGDGPNSVKSTFKRLVFGDKAVEEKKPFKVLIKEKMTSTIEDVKNYFIGNKDKKKENKSFLDKVSSTIFNYLEKPDKYGRTIISQVTEFGQTSIRYLRFAFRKVINKTLKFVRKGVTTIFSKLFNGTKKLLGKIFKKRSGKFTKWLGNTAGKLLRVPSGIMASASDFMNIRMSKELERYEAERKRIQDEGGDPDTAKTFLTSKDIENTRMYNLREEAIANGKMDKYGNISKGYENDWDLQRLSAKAKLDQNILLNKDEKDRLQDKLKFNEEQYNQLYKDGVKVEEYDNLRKALLEPTKGDVKVETAINSLANTTQGLLNDIIRIMIGKELDRVGEETEVETTFTAQKDKKEKTDGEDKTTIEASDSSPTDAVKSTITNSTNKKGKGRGQRKVSKKKASPKNAVKSTLENKNPHKNKKQRKKDKALAIAENKANKQNRKGKNPTLDVVTNAQEFQENVKNEEKEEKLEENLSQISSGVTSITNNTNIFGKFGKSFSIIKTFFTLGVTLFKKAKSTVKKFFNLFKVGGKVKNFAHKGIGRVLTTPLRKAWTGKEYAELYDAGYRAAVTMADNKGLKGEERENYIQERMTNWAERHKDLKVGGIKGKLIDPAKKYVKDKIINPAKDYVKNKIVNPVKKFARGYSDEDLQEVTKLAGMLADDKKLEGDTRNQFILEQVNLYKNFAFKNGGLGKRLSKISGYFKNTAKKVTNSISRFAKGYTSEDLQEVIEIAGMLADDEGLEGDARNQFIIKEVNNWKQLKFKNSGLYKKVTSVKNFVKDKFNKIKNAGRGYTDEELAEACKDIGAMADDKKLEGDERDIYILENIERWKQLKLHEKGGIKGIVNLAKNSKMVQKAKKFFTGYDDKDLQEVVQIAGLLADDKGLEGDERDDFIKKEVDKWKENQKGTISKLKNGAINKVKSFGNNLKAKAEDKLKSKLDAMKIASEEKKSKFEFAQAQIREKLKLASTEAREAARTAKQSATDAVVAGEEIKGVTMREKLKMAKDKIREKAKDLWSGFKEKAGGLMEMVGRGFSSLGKALSALPPITGRIAKIALGATGVAVVGGLVAKTIKKLNGSKGDTPPEAENANADISKSAKIKGSKGEKKGGLLGKIKNVLKKKKKGSDTTELSEENNNLTVGQEKDGNIWDGGKWIAKASLSIGQKIGNMIWDGTRMIHTEAKTDKDNSETWWQKVFFGKTRKEQNDPNEDSSDDSDSISEESKPKGLFGNIKEMVKNTKGLKNLSDILKTAIDNLGDKISEKLGVNEDEESTNSTSTATSSTNSGSYKGLGVVDLMHSTMNTLTYSNNKSANTESGKSNSASLVNWAYKKLFNTDIGNTSTEQFNSDKFTTIDKNSGKAPDESILKPGDVLFYKNSKLKLSKDYDVEVYAGNGKLLGFNDSSSNGPTYKDLTKYNPTSFVKAVRLKELNSDEGNTKSPFGVGNYTGNSSNTSNSYSTSLNSKLKNITVSNSKLSTKTTATSSSDINIKKYTSSNNKLSENSSTNVFLNKIVEQLDVIKNASVATAENTEAIMDNTEDIQITNNNTTNNSSSTTREILNSGSNNIFNPTNNTNYNGLDSYGAILTRNSISIAQGN